MSESNLELNGIIVRNPFAEILYEATNAGLSGSFRLASQAQKIAVYLDKGAVIYAASNLKQHRLPFCLLRWQVLSQPDLVSLQTAASDFEWSKQLVAEGKISPENLLAFQARQTSEIVEAALGWTTGEWTFTPLVRVREDLRVSIEIAPLLMDAARWLPNEIISTRFKSEDETFSPQAVFPNMPLTAEESFVLSRLDKIIALGELQQIGGLKTLVLYRVIYALWLGGFVKRFNDERAFSDEKIAQILSANLKLSKPVVAATNGHATEAVAPEPQTARTVVEKPEEKVEAPPPVEAEDEMALLEKFLQRVLPAQTHYQVLDIAQTADVREIKQAYFALAKRFHPDKFHHLGEGETRARLQEAFARVAQAHETLKDSKSRELYDFKIRKLQTENQNANANSSPETVFQQGVTALESRNYEIATALFARAVALSKQNGRYRAFYAKALATNVKFRHKAESEFQEAIKLEPRNADVRLMLVEFYRNQGFARRAESELKKLLEFAPNNQEARRLLDSLAAK